MSPRLLVPTLVLAALALACNSLPSPPPPPVVLRPEVGRHFEDHRELGQPLAAEWVTDWAGGPRQRVRTREGTFLFYMRNDAVVTVYREVDGELKETWRLAGY